MNGLITELQTLCGLFGPSGNEDDVRSYLRRRLTEVGYRPETDPIGNLLLFMGNSESDRTLFFEAHMDEVGFMIRGIDDKGLLRFGCVGGIDSRVLCGKRVVVRGKDDRLLYGVIGSKPIHLQEKEERSKVTPVKSLYIDIGAADKEDAEAVVHKGDFAVFDSEFVCFGEKDCKIKAKAIDDRLGCAILLRIALQLAEQKIVLPYRLVFSFGVREEVGYSGAIPAAFRVRPTHGIVLESTAVADLSDVPDFARVADQGKGGAISVADNRTIYDRDMIRFALSIGEKENIPVQLKRYVSGGNNARHLQQTATGAKVLALSAPTRYIHSAACVVDARDCLAMEQLSLEMILQFPDYIKKEVNDNAL